MFHMQYSETFSIIRIISSWFYQDEKLGCFIPLFVPHFTFLHFFLRLHHLP